MGIVVKLVENACIMILCGDLAPFGNLWASDELSLVNLLPLSLNPILA